jgi:hypothetical protein
LTLRSLRVDKLPSDFGKISNIPYAEARKLFLDHLKNVSEGPQQRKAAISCEVLCDLHLDWLQKNRSKDFYKQRQYLLSKWCDFEVGQGTNRMAIGDMAAIKLAAEDLLAWKEQLQKQNPQTGMAEFESSLALAVEEPGIQSKERRRGRDCQPPNSLSPFLLVS